MYNLAVICLCVIIALVDVKTYRIPDILLVLFLPVILIPEGNHPHFSVVSRLIAALAAFIFFGLIQRRTLFSLSSLPVDNGAYIPSRNPKFYLGNIF
jgi:Flp pilus assembly protein protease CpaA